MYAKLCPNAHGDSQEHLAPKLDFSAKGDTMGFVFSGHIHFAHFAYPGLNIF